MTHWFDRMSRAAAGEVDVSRRGLFTGAGLAAVAASPLGSEAWARAALHVEARAAQTACETCLKDEIKDHKKTLRNCDKSGNVFGVVPPAPKGKGKKKKAPTPVSAAQKLACAFRAEASHAFYMKDCAQTKCRSPRARHPPGGTGPDGKPLPSTQNDGSCPSNTSLCTRDEGGLCCFGDDKCCACGAGGKGSWICCASVVGCTCCG